MKKLLIMFISFFKIGAFTFGGGYAMIPIIEAEVVNKKRWLEKEEFLDILAISQSFPGALAVNSSIFIGYKIGGILGGILALLGVVLPSFFIILIVAIFFQQFRNNPTVELVFKGISAAVPMLVLVAVISLSKSVNKNLINLAIVLFTVIAISFLKIHPILVIILSALYGLIFLGKKVN
ncbi:putative chromate transport protein [Clostridium homopropionicum DSM 5847]|uniref:Putative chromate transport protein n=1 Tax=Clostridium homopropionicum DSM 5847 TaxID=1121318 RepID=A0A0L6ZE92_9CLOT|nr:chromate transporter [Clostridium homopropionicum]KOA21290.1 putative chromate transport protein [Clostridium homopropionicum DSM 5847]SFG30085.1 chromate transporter [Clostridium homopropionicum]